MAFPDFAGRSAAGLGRAAASAFLSACALAVRHDMGFGICPELAGLRPVLHRRALLLFLVTAAALLKPSCLDVFRASAVFFRDSRADPPIKSEDAMATERRHRE